MFPGRFVVTQGPDARFGTVQPEATMNGIIYLVGLIVVIMAILSLFGLR